MPRTQTPPNQQRNRARRSSLAVPGSQPRFHAKAHQSSADQVVSALRTYGFARKLRSVRVNAYDTAWCDEDIVVVMEGAGDKVDSLVAGQMERKLRLKTRVGLELLIESAHGVENIGLIAAASDRNEALIFGPADLAASLRIAAAFNSLMQVAAERIRRTGPYPHLLARTFGADDGGWLG